MAEHLISNQEVPGSSPGHPANLSAIALRSPRFQAWNSFNKSVLTQNQCGGIFAIVIKTQNMQQGAEFSRFDRSGVEPEEKELFADEEDTDVEDLRLSLEAIKTAKNKLRPETAAVLNEIITAFENYYDPEKEDWVDLMDDVRSVLDSFDTSDREEIEERELELSEAGKLNALLTKANRLSPKERVM